MEGSDKSTGGFNDQSGCSIGKDALVRGSGVGDGIGIWEQEDNGDRFCGANRGIDVNPDGGEELKGMFKMGDLSNGKEAGVPLWVSSDSTSSRAKDLGIGTGAVGGVKPVDLGGLDKVRAEGPAPTAELEIEEPCLCMFPGRVSEGDLLDRETFRLVKNNPGGIVYHVHERIGCMF